MTAIFNKKSVWVMVLFFIFISSRSNSQSFLKVNGKKIVNEQGQDVFLRGMGLGGWLLQEGYMLKTQSFANAQWQIKQKITELVGDTKTELFYQEYHKNYVTRKDIDKLAEFGFNSIRLPFHYNILSPENSPGVYLEEGFKVIDSLLSWCADNEMYLILDMHAAPGGQSNENISDYNPAYPSLWESTQNQDRTVDIWRKIAERYVNEKWIGGYDLINEPKWDLGSQNQALRDLYIRITNSIRQVDTNHIIFIEGNWFATDFNGLYTPWDDNMVYSFHKYWNSNSLGSIQYMLDLRNSANRPLWLGESGENSNSWFVDCIQLMEDNDIGWCWWAHKKISTTTSPYSANLNSNYQTLLNYWQGQGNKPSSDFAYNSLMQMANDLKIENCNFRPDVVDALFRQKHNTSTIPYTTENKIPGIIYAANYDMGQQNYAYKDNDYQNIGGSQTQWNKGYEYRNDGVDIEKCSDAFSIGYNVGWIDDGEWLTYTVDIQSQGTYDINIRIASNAAGGKIILKLDSQSITGFLNINSTGGWQNWNDLTVSNISLPAGTHKLEVFVVTGSFNLEYLEFISKTVGIETEKTIPESFKVMQNFPNPFNPNTKIKYFVPKRTFVNAILFDSLGNEITVLVNKENEAGYHSVDLNSTDFKLSSGIYFYRFTFDGENSTTFKAILLK